MARIASIPDFLAKCQEVFPGKTELTGKEIKSLGVRIPGWVWSFGIEGTRPRRFDLNKLKEKINTELDKILPETENIAVEPEVPANTIESEPEFNMYVPEVDEDFMPVGSNYEMVDKIVSSNIFFPCYIYGISGVGKTASIEYACATHKRPFFRVQITQETVDEDLIGSMRLKDGNTIWEDGPVIRAYRTGGVCVLDEMDLNAQLMILQPILEGKPFYIKQTGELVHPKDGFTVFATGNTKGDGTDMRYIGTMALNEAFLERFAITLEQSFMTPDDEFNVAKLYVKRHNINIKMKLLKELIKMVNLSRENYVSNGYDGAFISTRRIRFILKAYSLVGDMTKAIDMATTRYSDTYREALGMLWNSIHKDEPEETETANEEQNNSTSIPLHFTNGQQGTVYDYADYKEAFDFKPNEEVAKQMLSYNANSNDF